MTVYPNDLLIYNGSEAEHEVHLHWVFDHLHEETLLAKCKKCKFGKDLVKYLGHFVGQDRMHMDRSEVQAITK